jgi:Patched family
MGASIFVGGLTTFLSVCPLLLSSTYIFITVFWCFFALVVLGFTHGLILLPVVLSLIGPVSTHHKELDSQSTTKKQRSPPAATTKGHNSSSESSTSSMSSNKHDEPILHSYSDEEVEERVDKKKALDKKRAVPFLGPSYELEMIEEGQGSRPESTTSAKSRRSNIMEAPSDELQTPRALSLSKAAMASTILGKLAAVYSNDVLYNCGAELSEFDFFETVATHTCSSPTTRPPKMELS